MAAGIATTLDRLAAIVGLRATIARGVLDEHGRSEPFHAPRPTDIVAFPEVTQEIHPSSDLRA